MKQRCEITCTRVIPFEDDTVFVGMTKKKKDMKVCRAFIVIWNGSVIDAKHDFVCRDNRM